MQISLNEQIRKCDHCGATNIKQTYELNYNGESLYIGRVCMGNLLGVDTSGNKYKALLRVQRALFSLSDEGLEILFYAAEV